MKFGVLEEAICRHVQTPGAVFTINSKVSDFRQFDGVLSEILLALGMSPLLECTDQTRKRHASNDPQDPPRILKAMKSEPQDDLALSNPTSSPPTMSPPYPAIPLPNSAPKTFATPSSLPPSRSQTPPFTGLDYPSVVPSSVLPGFNASPTFIRPTHHHSFSTGSLVTSVGSHGSVPVGRMARSGSINGPPGYFSLDQSTWGAKPSLSRSPPAMPMSAGQYWGVGSAESTVSSISNSLDDDEADEDDDDMDAECNLFNGADNSVGSYL